MFALFLLAWLGFAVMFLFYFLRGIFEKEKRLWLRGFAFLGASVVSLFLMALFSPDDSKPSESSMVEVSRDVPAADTSTDAETDHPADAASVSESSEPVTELSADIPREEPEHISADISPEDSADLSPNDLASYSYEERYAIFIASVRLILKKNYGDNSSCSDSEDAIMISVWNNGVTLGALAAIGGDDSARDSWQGMSASFRDFSQSLCETAVKFGIDKPIMVNVLNDMNKDRILLSYVNGVLVYDIVQDNDI